MTAVRDWDVVGPNVTDADLVRASLAGSRSAFGEMYDRYANRLHDFCIGMLHDRDGAADCVQDCFCVAATRLPQLRDPDKLRPWLYSIARNEALRRIRDRRRETPSDELPDEATSDPDMDTLAARTELADLIADAAGGLSDRDRSVLELAFRHGLNGPDLAEALGVTPTHANTIVHRLRDTIERSLGALLVARRVHNSGGCPALAAILHDWDGHFNALMRKRISRHIESCGTCDEQRRELVSPAALLAGAPAFIPAPAWLRERTLSEIQLTSYGSAMDGESGDAAGAHPDDAGASHTDGASADRRGRRRLWVAALLIAVLGASTGLMLAWMNGWPVSIMPSEVSGTVPEPTGQTPAPSQSQLTPTAIQVPPQAPMLTPGPVTPPVQTPVFEPTPEVLPPDRRAPADPVPPPDEPSLERFSPPSPPPMSFAPTVLVTPTPPPDSGGDGGADSDPRRAGSTRP